MTCVRQARLQMSGIDTRNRLESGQWDLEMMPVAECLEFVREWGSTYLTPPILGPRAARVPRAG